MIASLRLGGGRPAHVLLSIEDYRTLAGGNVSLIDLLAMPGSADIDFEPPPLEGRFSVPADLS